MLEIIKLSVEKRKKNARTQLVKFESEQIYTTKFTVL